MRVSPRMKILWAAAIVWPILWMSLGFPAFFRYIGVFPNSKAGVQAPPMPSFLLLFPFVFVFHLLAIVCMIGVTALSIAHIISNERLSVRGKAIWAACMMLGFMVTAAVYWFMHIRPDTPQSREESNG